VPSRERYFPSATDAHTGDHAASCKAHEPRLSLSQERTQRRSRLHRFRVLRLRTFVIGPNGNFIEVRIIEGAIRVVQHANASLPESINDDRGAYFQTSYHFCRILRPLTYAVTSQYQLIKTGHLPRTSAPRSLALSHEHLVKLGSCDLPSLSNRVAVVAIEEIERLGAFSVRLYETDTVLFGETGSLISGDEAESFQWTKGKRNQRFADVITGSFLPRSNTSNTTTVFR